MPGHEWTSPLLTVSVTPERGYILADVSPRSEVAAARDTASPGLAGQAPVDVHEQLLRALEDQGLQRTPDAPPLLPDAAAAASANGSAKLSVSRAGLAENESAVLLLERGGYYTWHKPESNRQLPAPAADGTAPRTVTFEVELPAAGAAGPDLPAPAPVAPAAAVRSHVFTFAAGLFTGPLVAFLERNIIAGLVDMTPLTPGAWVHTDLTTWHPPTHHAPRVLLFLHGTFSSTVGSFGALVATKDGSDFLATAAKTYDLVIGYDHPTLSKDPYENACDLLARLERLPLKEATVDVVSFSRGALVARSLVEELLPNASWDSKVRTMVFVAGPNDGTELAEPAQWGKLVDLYTTLAVAAAKDVAALAGGGLLAGVLAGAVRGLGALVKLAVVEDVHDALVPGLAAMQPSGGFVTTINQTQPGQPVPPTPWSAVTADFDPVANPGGLPARLVAQLVNGLVDQVFGEDNDLVVNTASMTQIDPQAGNFIADRLSFGPGDGVYHLNYFVQPSVAGKLKVWLKG